LLLVLPFLLQGSNPRPLNGRFSYQFWVFAPFFFSCPNMLWHSLLPLPSTSSIVTTDGDMVLKTQAKYTTFGSLGQAN
jgi:hypothetical protein